MQAGSGRNFVRDLQEFARRTNINMPKLQRMVALEMYKRIIMRTPVLTGRARANWIMTSGGPDFSIFEKEDKQGSATISTGLANISEHKQGSIFITNNLPYIMRLEYGWSKTKAPNGMVRITIKEFNAIARRLANSLKNEK